MVITTTPAQNSPEGWQEQSISNRVFLLVREPIQLLYWIFFRPTAWARRLAQIDPRLSSQFSLAAIPADVRHQPALRRLLFEGYVILPLLITLGLGLLGISGPDIAYAVILALTVSVPLGFSIGFAASLGVLACISVLGGLNQLVVAYASVDIMGLAAGLSGALVIHLAPHQSPWTAVRQVGRGLMGILIVGVVIGAAFGLLALLTGSAEGGMQDVELAASAVFDPLGLPLAVAHALAWGIALFVGAFVPTMMAAGWHSRNWREGLRVALLAGLVFGLSMIILNLVSGRARNGEIFQDLENVIGRGAIGLATGVLFAWYITILYVLGDIFGGRIAAAVAGALGAIGWEGFWLVSGIGSPLDMFRISYGIILGLTFYWWWPGLVWPVQAIYGYVLYLRAQVRSRSHSPDLPLPTAAQERLLRSVRRHPAFQDETQFLPLPALDSFLVLIAERSPVAGQDAFAELAVSPHRWAVQAAQIELDARQLERCTDLASIGRVHRFLNTSDIEEPRTPFLRGFARRSQDVAAAMRQHSSFNQRLALRDVEDHLDGQMHEFYRNADRYAVRFLPIVIMWHQVIGQQIERLTATAELRQEIDNPYIISVPITTEQEIFVGRADISLRIEQFLADPRNAPILLYGQRRMGKTSLLHNLARLLPSTILPVFVDLQGAPSQARDHAGFLYSLASDMTISARQSRAQLLLPPLAYETLQQDPFLFFDQWLNEVEARLGPNRILLELDEFETLEHALAEGRFSEQAVLGMLRHLIQHRPRFKLLLSGSHTLDELHRWSAYMVNLQVVKIGYLREEETSQLIEAPIPGFPLRYDPAASTRMRTLTRGYPLLVQLLCSEMVALKNEQPPARRRWATSEDVEEAARRTLQTGTMVFADIAFNQIDEAGEAVLRTLAAEGEGAALPWEILVTRVSQAGSETLTRIVRRDLLEIADGGYRFQVELIRRWFAGDTAVERKRDPELVLFTQHPRAAAQPADPVSVVVGDTPDPSPVPAARDIVAPSPTPMVPPIARPRLLLSDYIRWLGVAFFMMLGLIGFAGVAYGTLGPKPRFVEGWPVLVSPGWSFAMYEIDDTGEAKINGITIAEATDTREKGMGDVTTYMKPGEDNRLEITIYNMTDVYTWGLAVAHNGRTVWADEDGRRSVRGAHNNDRSHEHQIVHQVLLILHPDGSVTATSEK